MSGSDEPAGRYPASGNERDPAGRRAMADGLWTDDAGCADPIVAAEGRDAIDDVVATARRQFPGPGCRPAGKADGHHDVAHPAREPAPAGGPAVIAGLAVMVTGRARPRRVHGFPDPVLTDTIAPGAGS
ncbi:nuclear transport factor 2 family protein [Streptomyces caelestis]|uniref:Nuclear transport factor 2 family protein n=1 Tax=Streptomyces heliomycini TaxID=284032 RepID=A0ABV5LHV4_9ACTN